MMPRELHHKTKVQRAETGEAASPRDRERGYEKSDAPPRRVLLGLGLFALLMTAGLAGAGAALGLLGGRVHSPAVPAPAAFVADGAPLLLAEPVAARLREQADSPDWLDDEALKAGEQDLLATGWPNPGRAPSEQNTAKAHVEARR